jgi:GT2 family glycosyltransferase
VTQDINQTHTLETSDISESTATTVINEEDMVFIKSVVEEEFDEEFYREHTSINEDKNALEHFLEGGWKNGEDPCEWFSVSAYLELNPDVKKAQINPFFHYLETGKNENRPVRVSQKKFVHSESELQHAAHVVEKDFDEIYYREKYNIAKHVDAIEHYLKTGWRLGYNPNIWFSTSKYLNNNLDVANSGIEPFSHFLTDGLSEKRPLYSSPKHKSAPEALSPLEASAKFADSTVYEVASAIKSQKDLVERNWINWTSKLKTVDGAPEFVKAHLEFAVNFAGGKEGVILGWLIAEGNPIVWAEDAKGHVWFLDNAFRTRRADVHQAFLKSSFNCISEELGFAKRINDMAQTGSLTLKALSHQGVHILGSKDIENIGSSPVQAAHWLFGMPTATPNLAERFSQLDLPVMETIISEQRKKYSDLKQEVKQYGPQNSSPEVSVIIPLYGRIDFIESQMVCFATDNYMTDNTEIIYVVDDPSLLSELATTAEQLYNLYQVPFKTVWGSTNRGFSGANNLGAEHAYGDLLLFLNSDVFPKQSGWLEQLKQELLKSDKNGVVAPRLTFGDGSIQHAGIEFKHRTDLGIYINHHPQMGLTPELDANSKPTVLPAVTGACMLIRRRDFDAIEGWDTGYLIGDFEDSDLCLKLRSMGKNCVYTPNIELTHLERQSFNLTGAGDFRMKVVILNAVRHQERWNGLLAGKQN